MTTSKAAAVVFQCPYGAFQRRYLWFIPVLGTAGLILAPAGILWNKGWEMGGRPVEPWAATLILEILAVAALMIAAAFALSTSMRRKRPQRVAVTNATLIVPKSMFSNAELVLPRSEIDLKVFNAGIVKQLQIKHQRRKILLSSALFPSDADFDGLVSHVL